MIRFLARVVGGLLLVPLLPLFLLDAVWRRFWPVLSHRVFGPVRHRTPPARWAHHAWKRTRIWWAER